MALLKKLRRAKKAAEVIFTKLRKGDKKRCWDDYYNAICTLFANMTMSLRRKPMALLKKLRRAKKVTEVLMSMT